MPVFLCTCFFALWKFWAVSNCCRLPAKHSNKLLFEMSTRENTSSSGASPMENDLLLFVCSPWTFSCGGTTSVLPIPFKCLQVKGRNLRTDLPAKSSEFLSRPILVDCTQNALINITSCNFHSWKNTLFWPESYEKKSYFLCVPLEPFPIVAQLQFSSLTL